jgi:hypothetical protein
LNGNALQSELDRVISDLSEARMQYATIGARIAGLEAQQLALRAALAKEHTGHNPQGASGYRTDAIVSVLEASGVEMSIRDVIAGLANVGRPGETYDNVGADLAYLTDRGRVTRVRRGVYLATHEQRLVRRRAGHGLSSRPQQETGGR